MLLTSLTTIIILHVTCFSIVKSNLPHALSFVWSLPDKLYRTEGWENQTHASLSEAQLVTYFPRWHVLITVSPDMTALLAPSQPGFGVMGACGHVRRFTPGYAISKA